VGSYATDSSRIFSSITKVVSVVMLSEFVKEWDGKTCDVDGFPKNNPYQCMDLMHQYLHDVFGLSFRALAAVNAKTVYTNFNSLFLHELFEKIPNSSKKEVFPQQGDVVLWDGVDGHVAIFIVKVSDNDFHSFDQNYPVGSRCHVQYHNYTNVLGWLRLKGGVMEPDWKQSFLQLGQSFGDQFDESWNPDEKKVYIKKIQDKASDYKKRADNPPSLGDSPKTLGEALILAGSLAKEKNL